MNLMRKEALLHMGKALDLLDLDVVSPAVCFLQMAIDLVKEEVMLETASSSRRPDHGFASVMTHDAEAAE